MRFFVLFILLGVVLPLGAQSVVTWSPTAEVAASQFDNMHPRVVTDGDGNPMVLWGSSSSKEVLFSRWTGNSFSIPVRLNPQTIPIFAASWAGPDIASHGDTVYVVFKETPEDASGIYIVRSIDGGANFSDPVRVDALVDSRSRFPAVSTDANGHPLVAFMKLNQSWGEAHYVLAKSEDYGDTFSADVVGSRFSGGDVCDCCPASAISSGNTTALLYRDNLNNLRNSWAGISFDGGSSFAGGIEIDDTDWMINACPSSGPDGVIYGDSLYAVFMSAASGKSLVYRSRSTLSNLQMQSIEPVTGSFTGLSQQNFPRIAASGKAVAAIWTQNVNGSAQLAVQFTDNISNGFLPGYEVLASSNVMNADVSISPNGKLYVVWEDMNSGTVKYKTGTFTVSGLAEQSSNQESIRVYPNPASSSGFYVHFATTDDAQVHYSIADLQGLLVGSGSAQVMDGMLKFETSGLSNGVYFIRMYHHDKVELGRLIIQK